MTAKLISVNEKPVLEGAMLFAHELFQDRIDKVILKNEYIKTFAINLGGHDNHSLEIINELIGRLLM